MFGVGTVLLVTLLILRSRFAVVVLIGLLSIATYLVFRNRKSSWRDDTTAGSRISRTAAIAFFLCLSSSAILLRSPITVGERSDFEFVASAVMFGIVSFQAVFGLLSPRSKSLYLLEAFLAAFWVRLAPQLLSPGVLGIDSWFHLGIVQQILDTGFVPTGTVYSGLAHFHILMVSFAQVTGFEAPIPAEHFLALVGASGAPIVYLLGREFFDERISLVGAVVYGFAPQTVAVGFEFIPSSLGIVFLILSLYGYFRYLRERTTGILSVTILAMVALIFTHTLVAFMLFVLMATHQAGEFASTRFFHLRLESLPMRRRTPLVSVFFGVTMISWWTYVSGSLTGLVTLLGWSLFYEPWTPTPASQAYLSSIPLLEYSLNLAGFLAIAGLAVVGTLRLLAPDQARARTFGPVAMIWSVGSVGLLSIAGGLSGLLGLRWIVGFEALSGLLVGPALIFLANASRKKWVVAILISALVSTAAFTAIASPTADFDTSILSPNTTVRLSFTPSELSSMRTIASFSPSRVEVLYPDLYYFEYYLNTPSEDVGQLLQSRILGDIPAGWVVLRADSTNSPIYYYQTLSRLDYDAIAALAATNSVVFDSGSVTAIQ